MCDNKKDSTLIINKTGCKHFQCACQWVLYVLLHAELHSRNHPGLTLKQSTSTQLFELILRTHHPLYNTLVPISRTTIVSKSENLLLCRGHRMPDGDAASPQARQQTQRTSQFMRLRSAAQVFARLECLWATNKKKSIMLSDMMICATGAWASPWCVPNWVVEAVIWRRRWPGLWKSPDFLLKNKKQNSCKSSHQDVFKAWKEFEGRG